MLYEVLYQRRAAWLVGETKEEAIARHGNALATSLAENQYPNDYAGRVVSLQPSGQKPSLRAMAGDLLAVAEWDLAPDDLMALRNRSRKVSPGLLSPVTFDDRWGQLASVLRANFEDAEQAEREVTDEASFEGMRFGEVSALAKKMLAKTRTHTGTGKYYTKASPAKVEDTQDGAPVGQVVNLTTGGLGTASAFEGGYAKNLGIVSGSDDQPTATSNSTPAGHAWAASIDTSAAAWKAADDNVATSWLDTWTGPEWWEYTPPSSKQYGKVSIQAKSVIVAGRLPKDFKAQGWNGSSWIDLVIVTNETGWSASEKRSWKFTANIALYSKYRIYITANNGDSFIEIGEVEWFATTEEVRSIVSHVDDAVTLEGSLTNWTDLDCIEVYDAWSTIQAALDQLWTDQGSSTFTASQYVRVFAGTYDETVTPNAAFDPDETNGFALVLEGDGTDSRANININPTSGSPAYGIYWDCDSGIIRHLKVDGSSLSVMAIRAHTGCTASFHVRDCELSGPSGVFAQSANPVGEDCKITFTSGAAFYGNRSITVKRCELIGPGKTSGSYTVKAYGNLLVEACTIRSCDVGIQLYDPGEAVIEHCSIYNCNYGIHNGAGLGTLARIVNTIISSCNYAYYSEVFPGSVAESPQFVHRNNCYYDYATAFAHDGSTTKTYAEWIALGGVDSEEELDATNPLLTDPANGDFSLLASSPCINTGHGSGVITGQNAIAFDANHPDIGAWSSGEAAAHLTPVVDSWTNVGDGTSVSLTVSNVESSRTVHIFYRLRDSTNPFTESPTTRVGPGAVTLGSLSEGATYEVFAISSDGISSDMPSLPSNVLEVTPSSVAPGDEIALEGLGQLDLQLDDDCGDLDVIDLDLALIDGTAQVKQALCIALRTFRGEWFLDSAAGVPYYQNVLVKSPNISEINSLVKAEILKVTNVNKILEFSSTFDAPNRELSVSFRVDTTFGPVTIEETL